MSNGHDNPFDPNSHPMDPLLAVLNAKANSIPANASYVRPNQALPAVMPGGSALGAFFAELFGLKQPNMEQTGVTPTGGKPIDLTDPKVVPGDQHMSYSDQFIRKSRVLAAAMKQTLFGGGAGITGAGIERAEMSGELAPADDRERLIYQIAPILTSLGVFAPLGVAETGAKIASGGTSLLGGVLKGAGAGAAFNAPISMVEELQRHYGLPEDFGGGGALDLKGAAIGGAESGALFGGGLGGAAGLLGKISPSVFRFFMGARPMNPLAQVELANMITGMSEGEIPRFIPGPGFVVDGRQAIQLKNGQLRWRTKDPETGRWLWTKEPDETAIRNHAKDFLQKMQNQAQNTPEGQAAQAAMQQADPNNPQTLPPDIQPKQPQMETVGALYYRHQAANLYKKLREPNGKDLLSRKLEILKTMVFDPTLTEEERVSAGGQVQALERVLSEQQPGAARTPIDIEYAAVSLIKSLRDRGGSDEAIRVAAGQLGIEQPELANRIRELMNQPLPEAAHKKIYDRIEKANTASARGFKQGSTAFYRGKVVQVAGKIEYGLAPIREEGVSNGALDFADVSEFQPIPQAGSLVRMPDDVLYHVEQVGAEEGFFSGINIETGEKSLLPLSHIIEVSDADASRIHMESQRDAMAAPKTADINDVPRTKAVTTTGESVTVTGVGKDKVRVRTKSGRTKIIPREEIARSTDDKPEPPFPFAPEEAAPRAPGDRTITTFRPGTLPDDGHKLLFFRANSQTTPELERAIEEGRLNADGLRATTIDHSTNRQGQLTMMPHVLPPATVEGQTALYGVELPADALPMSNYTSQAKSAIKALQGKGTVDSYNSPVRVPADVFSAGRVYRIPNELVQRAQRPEGMLAGMDQGAHTDYLRNLINFNEHIDHEVAQSITKVRDAHTAATVALEANDGKGFVMAEADRAEAMKNVMEKEALAEYSTEALDNRIKAIMREAAYLDPEHLEREAFQKQGLVDSTKDYFRRTLKKLPAVAQISADDEYAVAPSKNIKGQRVRIFKRERPSYDPVTRQPRVESYYDLVPVDPNNNVLRDAVRQVSTEDEVAAYLQGHGYTPTDLKAMNSSAYYVHKSKPSISLHVSPAPAGGLRGIQEERVVVPVPKEGEAPYRPQETKLLARLSKAGINAVPGETLYLPGPELPFGSQAEVDAYAQTHDFEQIHGAEKSRSARFASLPSVAKLEENPNAGTVMTFTHNAKGAKLDKPITVRTPRLKVVESMLTDIIKDFVKAQRVVPDPVIEYAHDFAKLYEKALDQAPFDRRMRLDLGIPSPRDLAPNPTPGSPQDIDLADIPNVKFVKGMNAPSPNVTSLERHVYDGAGNLLEVLPEMHIRDAGGHVADDVTTLFTDLIGVNKGPTFPALDRAALAARQLAYINKWSEAYRKSLSLPTHGLQQFSPEALPLGRYKTTGQAVLITDVTEAMKGGEVKIKLPNGPELSVDQNLVDVAPGLKNYDRDMHDYALAGAIQEGKYGEYFRREPPIGFGKWEQSQGLLGASPTVVQSAMANRAAELAHSLIGTLSDIRGPKENVEELLDMYNRALWIKGETPPTLLEKATPLDAADAVMGAIKAINPKLEGPFRLAAYNKARADFGDTPYADIRAKVLAGMITPEKDKVTYDAIEELRTTMQMSKNVPQHKVVEAAIQNKLVDPNVARQAQVFGSTFLPMFAQADAADLPGNLKIVNPAAKDIGDIERYALTPWKMARRHPLAMLVDNMIRQFATEEQRYNQIFKDFSADLMQNGHYKLTFQSEDGKALRSALGTYDTWAEAEKGGVPTKYQYGFRKTRQFLNDRKDDHIRYYLQRQIQPVTVDLSRLDAEKVNGVHGRLGQYLASQGIDPDNIIDGFALLTKERIPGLNEGGETERWNHGDIEAFIDLLHRYTKSEELPPGTDPRFIKDFDFWKRYGRKNYFPLIHNGNVAISVVGDDGVERLAAFAPSIADAAEAYRALIEQGRILPRQDIKFKVGGQPVYDNVIGRVMGGMKRRDWDRMMKAFGEHIQADGEEIQAMFLKSRGEKAPGPAKGTLASAKPRTMGLESPFADFMQDLAAYTGRIARNQYQFKVANIAYPMLTDEALDRSLSAKHGVQRLADMRKLRGFMEDYIQTALGEHTAMDKVADKLWSYMKVATAGPTEAVRKAGGAIGIGEGSPIDWKNIMNPNTYFQMYSARARASEIIAFHAARKLAINPASALVNYFQFIQNAAQLGFQEGIPLHQSMADIAGAWADAHRMWYANTFGKEMPEHLKAVYPHIRGLGVDLQPAKQLAGGGIGWGDVTGTKPSPAGRTTGEHFWDMTKWVMMLPFNGGEETGRLATALLTYRQELRKLGIDWKDAAAIAKNAGHMDNISALAQRNVSKTFFHYDALGMPQAFSKLGPLGRLLFQFKPFMIQQMGFEYDLLRDMIAGKPNAARQFFVHLGTGAMLGGGTFLMSHPLFSYIGGAMKMFTHHDAISIAGYTIPLTAEALEAMADDNRRQHMSPEQEFTNSMNYRWDDILYYGLPGLAHLSIGTRIGISGMDMLPDFTNPGKFLKSELGPTFGPYADLLNLWGKYVQQRGIAPAMIGGLAGAAAAHMVPWLKNDTGSLPLTGTIGGLIGASVASMKSENPFSQFLNTSREGKQLYLSMLPAQWRNASRTYELLSTGALRNLDGEPMYVPAANRTEEAIALLTGFQSIRREENSAVVSFGAAQSARYENEKQTLVREIALATANGDTEKAWEASYRAMQLGIYIPENELQQELRNLTTEAINNMERRQAVQTRYMALGEAAKQ